MNKAEEFYHRIIIQSNKDKAIEILEQYANEQSREEAVKFLLEMRHCAIPNGINKDEQRGMAYVFYDEWKSNQEGE